MKNEKVIAETPILATLIIVVRKVNITLRSWIRWLEETAIVMTYKYLERSRLLIK
ncbi:hypothetical protein MGI18_13630 [Bacillus sp. OVS6]|nr:hypothetical protein MGI18_13630 [Bacillus sp. OVS6]